MNHFMLLCNINRCRCVIIRILRNSCPQQFLHFPKPHFWFLCFPQQLFHFLLVHKFPKSIGAQQKGITGCSIHFLSDFRFCAVRPQRPQNPVSVFMKPDLVNGNLAHHDSRLGYAVIFGLCLQLSTTKMIQSGISDMHPAYGTVFNTQENAGGSHASLFLFLQFFTASFALFTT